MLDAEASHRLGMVRFPLIVGVVFIHNYGSDMPFAGQRIGLQQVSAPTFFLQDLISQGLARIAVPLFFLMAGYFFFLDYRGTVDHYVARLSSRVRTLLIPFIFWNIATLAVYAVVQNLAATQGFVSGRQLRIAEFGVFDFFNALIGMTRPPIAYQFWFVRDLMVLVVLTPLLHLFLAGAPRALLVFLFFCWFADVWPLLFPSAEAVFFFALGAVTAHAGRSLLQFDHCIKALCVLYAAALVLEVYFLHTAAGGYLMRLGIVLGIPTMLGLTAYAVRVQWLRDGLLALAAPSFFVFAAHEPLLTVFKKIAFKWAQPSSSVGILALYLLIPLLLLVLLVALHRLVMVNVPGIGRLATGGR